MQEAFLPKTSIVGQNVFEILAQLCYDDSILILLNFRRICKSGFWQEGILDVFLLEYPDESHSFTNFNNDNNKCYLARVISSA